LEPITLIQQFGPWVGLIVFAAIQFLLMLRSTNKARSKAEEAAAAAREASTARDNAFTAQFTVFSEENRRLQQRVDTLETALAQQAAAGAVQQAAMKAAQDKAALLEVDVKTLTEKVAGLETERDARAGELERERRQSEIQQRELAAAKVEIASLQQRLSHIEGENAALRLMLEKIQIVKVEPEPEPDPPSPKPPAVVDFEAEAKKEAA